MNIYRSKHKLKIGLVILAVIFVFSSLYYANSLGLKLAKEERKKVELWASATVQLINANENTDINFLLDIIIQNKTIPVILVNEHDEIITHKNLDSLKVLKGKDYLANQLISMKDAKEPIVIHISEDQKNYIYYKDSHLLTQLKLFPIIQIGILGFFMLIAYMIFNISRSAEQNQVWAGMAKEAAHQLGTPISSLVAWIELLKSKLSSRQNIDSTSILSEMQADIDRLNLISERFSKIGSEPILTSTNIINEIKNSTEYVLKRASKDIQFVFPIHKGEIWVDINPQLFNWVLENLLKNALDAMDSNGRISINVEKHIKDVFIDISDSGHGMAKSNFKLVFNPGYSTKKRGWGLGLSLSKRIIEQYHKGKIFVLKSTINEGTTFRIVLPLSK